MEQVSSLCALGRPGVTAAPRQGCTPRATPLCSQGPWGDLKRGAAALIALQQQAAAERGREPQVRGWAAQAELQIGRAHV